MPVEPSYPKRTSIEQPLLDLLIELGGAINFSESGEILEDRLAKTFNLSDEQRNFAAPNYHAQGNRKWRNEIQFVKDNLVNRGLIDPSERNIWKVTPEGYSQGNIAEAVNVNRHFQLLAQLEKDVADEGEFNPASIEDAREISLRAMVVRSGQSKFRSSVLEAYGGTCCVTGCSVEPALEAAHIFPYNGEHTNAVQNGLLLRSDIHRLFDLGMLWVDPSNMRVCLSPSLIDSTYAQYLNLEISLPLLASLHPSLKALEWHMSNIADKTS
jgi:predicted restriction endonuclease